MREERWLRVFENRVLRRIFGSKRKEVKGEWRRLHNEELNALYSSPNIIRVIKSRRLRWAGHVSPTGKRKGVYRVLVGKIGGGDHMKDPGVDGRMILKWILEKWVGAWTESILLRIGRGGGLL